MLFSEVKGICAASDVIIACMGLDSGLEGEEGDTGNEYGSGDKPNLYLPGLQGKLLDAVTASGKPVIVVCLAGSAIYLDSAYEKAAATVLALYPGAQGGRAFAQILFGQKSPEGKLPVTFYGEKNTLPLDTDYSMKGRTYRYMTEKPFYPFGYGLSYTSFKETVDKIVVNDQPVSGDVSFNEFLTQDDVSEQVKHQWEYVKTVPLNEQNFWANVLRTDGYGKSLSVLVEKPKD